MPEKQYVQCHLRRFYHHTTAWIEKRGATVGAVVELMPAREKWRVEEVYANTVLAESQLKETQRLNRGSLPSIEPIHQ